jgi:hypothetical protein
MASTKNIHITVTEEEHAELMTAKGDKTWYEFLMSAAKKVKA